jgi:hypothetical protein
MANRIEEFIDVEQITNMFNNLEGSLNSKNERTLYNIPGILRVTVWRSMTVTHPETFDKIAGLFIRVYWAGGEHSEWKGRFVNANDEGFKFVEEQNGKSSN